MTDNTDDMDARQQKLTDQLAVSPIIEVLGVVSARGGGAGGGHVPGDELWQLSFRFDAWRIVGGEVQTGELLMSRKMPKEEMREWMDKIKPYSVLRVRARLGEPAFIGPMWQIEEFLGADESDATLNDLAEQLQQPVVFEDPLLGTFTLKRSVDCFSAEVEWGGQPITLDLSHSAEVEKSVQTAHALWQHQSEWNRRVRDFAVEELLPWKNDNWRGDDAELSPDEFKNRMTLEAIDVSPEGSFTFWHNDGGLFLGHAIMVGGDLAQGPTDADIPG